MELVPELDELLLDVGLLVVLNHASSIGAQGGQGNAYEKGLTEDRDWGHTSVRAYVKANSQSLLIPATCPEQTTV